MKKVLLGMFIPLAITLSGCFGVSSEFRSYQKDLTNLSGIKTAEKDVELSFGRFQLYLAEKLTGFADGDLLAEMTIHDISKFEIGVYETREYQTTELNFTVYEEALRDKGWVKFIKTVDGDDITNIYLNLEYDEEEIEEMMIVTTDSENVVLMRFEGNFNRIVDRLIKARKLALK